LFDLRYYIITITAVFLSLTLGIFIGNALLGNDLVIAQQQEVIEQLRQNFSKVQEENRSLQEQFRLFQVWEETNRMFEDLTLSLLGEKTTSRARLVIVDTGDRELASHLTHYLQQWGFAVAASCTIAEGLAPENEALQEIIQGRRDGSLSEQKWQELVSYLAGAVTGTRTTDLLEQLAARGFLTLSGSPAAGVEVVLLIGGEGEGKPARIDRLDNLLIEAWLQEGVRVIVGTRVGPGSRLVQYRREGVSTIGHLDTAAGRLSLYHLLTGAQEGHFGPGEEADELLPLQWLRMQVGEN